MVALGAVAAIAVRTAVAVALPGTGEHNSRLAAVMAVAVMVVGAAMAMRLEAATNLNWRGVRAGLPVDEEKG